MICSGPPINCINFAFFQSPVSQIESSTTREPHSLQRCPEPPKLTTHEPQTYRFALELLILPGILGLALGQIVDEMTHRAWTARNKLPETAEEEPLGKRFRRTCLVVVTARLLPDGPTTWDRTWNQIRRVEPSVLVRVTTKGGREIVGAVATASRVALSPQPHDLYIQQTVRQTNDGGLAATAFGLGTFVAGSEIESVEWVLQKGDEANG